MEGACGRARGYYIRKSGKYCIQAPRTASRGRRQMDVVWPACEGGRIRCREAIWTGRKREKKEGREGEAEEEEGECWSVDVA